MVIDSGELDRRITSSRSTGSIYIVGHVSVSRESNNR